MSVSTEFEADGATLVKATTNWSEPRLCTFSAKASTKGLNLVNVAILV